MDDKQPPTPPKGYERVDVRIRELADATLEEFQAVATAFLADVPDAEAPGMDLGNIMLNFLTHLTASMADKGACPHCIMEAIVAGLNMSEIAKNAAIEHNFVGCTDEEKSKLH